MKKPVPIVLLLVLFVQDGRCGCIAQKEYNMLIPYCIGTVTYPIDDQFLAGTEENITLATVADTNAKLAYQSDLAIWKNNRDVDCAKQVYNRSLCNNCLAMRRRLHCVSFLPKCTDSQSSRAVCKGLCEDVVDRCKSSSYMSCNGLPTEDCSSSATHLPIVLFSLLSTLLLVFLF